MIKLIASFKLLFVLWLLLISFVNDANAFWGCYLAKADTKLYDQASQVIIARHGKRTILTMSKEVIILSRLTGWNIYDIRKKINFVEF